jgi:hypothetical protein
MRNMQVSLAILSLGAVTLDQFRRPTLSLLSAQKVNFYVVCHSVLLSLLKARMLSFKLETKGHYTVYYVSVYFSFNVLIFYNHSI